LALPIMIAVWNSRFFVGGRWRANAIQRPSGEYLGSLSKPGRRIGSGRARLPSARMVHKRVSKSGASGRTGEEASVPADTPTVPPPTVVPPEDAAEIVRRHGNELLLG
jgi:hypothetical protein